MLRCDMKVLVILWYCGSTLKKDGDPTENSSALDLVMDLLSIKMTDTENASQYMARVETMVSNLTAIDRLPNVELILKAVLRGLTPRFSNIKTIIKESIDKLSLSEIRHKLISEESDFAKLDVVSEQTMEYANFVGPGKKALERKPGKDWKKQSPRVPRPNGLKPRKFRGQAQRRQKDDETSRREERSCFYCGKVGHLKAVCNLLKKHNKERGGSHGLKFKESSGDEFAYSMRDASHSVNNVLDETSQKNADAISDEMITECDQWLLDSGASSHLSPNKDNMLYYKTFDEAKAILLADNRKLYAIGSGDVKLVLPNNEVLIVHDVLHVKEAKVNLLSVSKLCAEGYSFSFEQNGEVTVCLVLYDGRLKAKATVHNNSFVVRCKKSIDYCRFTSNETRKVNIQDWHRRTGHQGINGTFNVAKRVGLDCSKREVYEVVRSCTTCIQGKFSRRSHNTKRQVQTRPLAILHADLFGPMKNLSFGGSRYCLVLTDEFTGFITTIGCKQKSDAADHIIFHIKSMERRLQHKQYKVQEFHSDNGTEFVNNKLSTFLREMGIMFTTSNVYTP